MIKKIGIITFWELPEGMAPTTRIVAYSKGLVENGVLVEIFSFRRIFKDEAQSIVKSGWVRGAYYSYLHYFNTRGRKWKAVRVLDELILRMKLFLNLNRSIRKGSFDAFLLSFDDLNSFGAYMGILRFFKVPLVFVADEFPIPIRDYLKDEVPAEMLVQYQKYHRHFAGRILMSHALANYYNETMGIKPTFILNTIIDSSRFTQEIKDAAESPYVCYMGNLDLRKDDVLNIISAFALIARKYPELDLFLFGSPGEEHMQLVLEKIASEGLENRIFYKGRATYEQVPCILKKATILVNALPVTKRAEGGFPTKLGEYLLSCRPSIFTESGDIKKYLQDGVHAFIVPPEDAASYADKMSYILENYEKASDIAAHGAQFIRENFNALEQTKELIGFLYKLANDD